MFITNISEFPKKNIYLCDKEMSDKLIENGFSLLGIYGDKYCYYKTKKLLKYLLRNEVNVE